MPQIDSGFWLDQVTWAVKTLAHYNGAMGHTQLVKDLQSVVEIVIAALATIPLGKPLKLVGWAIRNPDPLRSARKEMEGVRKKWDR